MDNWEMDQARKLANEFLAIQQGSVEDAILLAEDLPEGEFRDQVILFIEEKDEPTS